MHITAPGGLVRVMRGTLVALLGALVLTACQVPGASAPTASAPIGTATDDSASNAAGPNQSGPSETTPIVIDEPAFGASVSSPMRLRGRLAAVPPEGGLTYRILDAENILLASGTIATSGERGNVGSFDVEAVYTSPVSGPGFLQLVQRTDLGGPAVAVSTQPIVLAPNVTTPPTAIGMIPTTSPEPVEPTSPIIIAPTFSPVPATPTVEAATPTPVPPTQPQGQVITITSPTNGTQVGSPLTITGNTNQFPFQGSLDYRVVNSANQLLGQGSFAVNGAPGQATNFVAELRFNLPAGGGPIRVDVYDEDTNGRVAALASVDLVIAPPQPTAGPQQITISSPPPGTVVGSPIVVTGSTTRFPAQGNLKYRFLDQFSNQLGAGTVTVNGSQGQPGTFNASLNYALPQGGGPLRLELVDRDLNNGQVFATTTLDMQVAPPPTAVPPQRVSITSPPVNTQVGSPVTITGNTQNYPTGGVLNYRVGDANGQQLGIGTFRVNGAPGQSTTFAASLTFNLPPNGGAIQVDILDRDPNGTVIAISSVRLIVAPPPPTVLPYPQPR